MNYTIGLSIIAAIVCYACVHIIRKHRAGRVVSRGYVCVTCNLPYNPSANTKQVDG